MLVPVPVARLLEDPMPFLLWCQKVPVRYTSRVVISARIVITGRYLAAVARTLQLMPSAHLFQLAVHLT